VSYKEKKAKKTMYQRGPRYNYPLSNSIDKLNKLNYSTFFFAPETNYDYIKNPAIRASGELFSPVSKGVQINFIFP
jgi:hypothetical protein